MRARGGIAAALLVGLVLATGAGAQPYERSVYAFPVADAAGTPYAHPLLGGLDLPRPQFVDIDADGDLDLFVQDVARQLLFFENTGTPAAPRFTWRTDRYGGLEVGEWFRFVDLDADGDVDLLADQPFSYVRYYRNDGTPAAPVFTPAADTLRDTAGQPITTDTGINVPAAADLRCAGRPDLFLGKTDGTLTRYEHLGVDADGVPRFRFDTDFYQQIRIVGQFGGKRAPGDGLRHGANAIAFADVDGDGRPDLLWGDYFSPSLYYLRHTGTCEAPRLERTADVFPTGAPLQTGGYNMPVPADLDADGDLDLFAGVLGGAFGTPTVENFYFYEQTGVQTGTFALRTRRFLSGFDVGEESAAAPADLDGDGDLDLLVGNRMAPDAFASGTPVFLENTGTAAGPAFRERPAGFVRLDAVRFNLAPAFGDLDGDGDLDLLAGGYDGTVALARNAGTAAEPAFVLVDSAYVEVAGSSSAPALADLDADGDLDLLVGEAAGDLSLFRNEGTPQVPAFVSVPGALAHLRPGRHSHPAVADVDADGVPDLLVGSGAGGVVWYRNEGTVQAPAFTSVAAVLQAGPAHAAPAPADLDSDGDLDLLVGGGAGGLVYLRNQRVATAVERPPHGFAAAPFLTNHPNPFAAHTLLRFRLAHPAHVRLVVYDGLGREAARLYDALLPAGEHAVPFAAGPRPPGLYLARLTVDGTFRAVRLMMRVR